MEQIAAVPKALAARVRKIRMTVPAAITGPVPMPAVLQVTRMAHHRRRWAECSHAVLKRTIEWIVRPVPTVWVAAVIVPVLMPAVPLATRMAHHRRR